MKVTLKTQLKLLLIAYIALAGWSMYLMSVGNRLYDKMPDSTAQPPAQGSKQP